MLRKTTNKFQLIRFQISRFLERFLQISGVAYEISCLFRTPRAFPVQPTTNAKAVLLVGSCFFIGGNSLTVAQLSTVVPVEIDTPFKNTLRIFDMDS